MRLLWNSHILTCIILFASYRKSQARPVKKLFFNSPTQKNVHTKLSSKMHTDTGLHGKANCVQVGLRNMICVYNQGRLVDVPLHDEHKFSDSEYHFWTDTEPEYKDPDEFIDLTRSDHYHGSHGVGRTYHDIDGSFSEDYLDIGDLSITRKVDTSDIFTPRSYRELNIYLTMPENRRLDRRGFSFPDPRILSLLAPKPIAINEAEENTSAEEDSSSDDDDSKPKRFEVIQHSESSEESDPPPKKVPKKTPKKGQKSKSKLMYMQAPTRIMEQDRRRRLPHFLPKFYHWNAADRQKLPYLWFQGPQGQYAGTYRKPY